MHAQHFMQSKDWQWDVINAINNQNGQIHVTLDGIDQTPMNMILNPNRSGFNWEMNQLYQYKDVFSKTIFYYNGQTYIGYDVFKIIP